MRYFVQAESLVHFCIVLLIYVKYCNSWRWRAHCTENLRLGIGPVLFVKSVAGVGVRHAIYDAAVLRVWKKILPMVAYASRYCFCSSNAVRCLTLPMSTRNWDFSKVKYHVAVGINVKRAKKGIVYRYSKGGSRRI